MENSELISADEAAEFLGVSAGTLAVWRSTRRYSLPFVKMGHLVRYRKGDLAAFIERRVVNMPSPRQTKTVARRRSDRTRRSA